MDQVTVRAWGNSQGIRIPKAVLDELDIHESDILELTIEDGNIVLKKSFKHKSFEERLEAYHGKISVGQFEWGEAKGKELL